MLSLVLICSTVYVNVFATSPRKGPCDSVGGTLKRLFSRASLQRSSKKQILSPRALLKFAIENIMSILFEFVNAEEIIKESQKLEKRLIKACRYCQAPHLYSAHRVKSKAYNPKILLSFLST